ncbi:MAG: peroxidase family protein [Acidimicrobiales bacterium]
MDVEQPQVAEVVSGGANSRRSFLKTLGGGMAGAVILRPGLAGAEDAQTVEAAATEGGSTTFGRMFPGEPPFAENSQPLRAALKELGRPGGILDAGDALDRGAAALIADPTLNMVNRNNPTHTTGTTFMGQFMDHDVTFDATSRLATPTAPKTVTNVRTPAFDLDTVYGGGPVASPQLYDGTDAVRFKVESGGRFEDLPRASDNSAIIADPRNDENLVISGLHAAFLKFHNNAVDLVRSQGVSDVLEVFDAARRLTTWHYQWMVLHEFLPLFIGQAMTDKILARGRKHYLPTTAFMPVEFQGAAYRFGHSMIRPSYPANATGDNGTPFIALIFDPAEIGKADPNDLSGSKRAPRRFIDWNGFFDFGDGRVGQNKRVDTRISTPLFNLPPATIRTPAGAELGPTALAQRTLLRHITWGLPSGQRLAQRIGVPALTKADLAELSGLGLGLRGSTPLWYYVLREAEIATDGLHLGPVGGRIVGEVIIGLLQTDPGSYVSVDPAWVPTLPSRGGSGDFRMADLLTFAGVDPLSRTVATLP